MSRPQGISPNVWFLMPEMWSLHKTVDREVKLRRQDAAFIERYNTLVNFWKEEALQDTPLGRWQFMLTMLLEYGAYSAECLAAETLIYIDYDFSQDKLPKKRGRPRKTAIEAPGTPKDET